MSQPENPNTIIVKNKYYPKGLTEGQVWEYYQKYKGPILNETRGRDVMFAIMVDVNKPILRRKGAGEQFITLTNSNYDTIITGRTIALYSTMKSYEEFGIVDIDVDNFRKAQEAALDVYYELKNTPFIQDVQVRFSGKTSFHIVCQLYNQLPIDKIRDLFQSHLKNSNLLVNKYTMEYKRKKGTPNLDLSSNKFRGAYITLGSLSVIGLKCMEVLYNRVHNFNPISATIL